MMSSQTMISSFVLIILAACLFDPSVASSAPTIEQCTDEVSKVTQCLSFVQGKADKPSKDCCTSVKEIKDEKPACLCLVIQQTHDGAASFKQLGIKEDKLVQLSSACSLANASLSDCPKLLGLSPSSPDNAIFTNSATTAPSSSNSSTTTPSSTSKDDTSASTGFVHGPYLAVMVVTYISLFVFSTGSLSIFSVGA